MARGMLSPVVMREVGRTGERRVIERGVMAGWEDMHSCICVSSVQQILGLDSDFHGLIAWAAR
jgi:hypothetical protein